jgi:Tfp pilus assembly protein PilO
VLVLALWWTMLLKPARAKASKVRADTATEQTTLDPLEAQLAQANRDAANAATFKAQLESLQQAMPDSPALAAFIRSANDIADASGVSWQSVTHGPPTVGTDGTTTITVGIQVKGTYAQVMEYLTRLAKLERLLVVDGVQVSTAGTSGASTGPTTGLTTGPFSGASELSATISARMFESSTATAPSTGTATAAASTPAGGSGVVAPAGTTAGLNNS